jgi:hypothetical protein
LGLLRQCVEGGEVGGKWQFFSVRRRDKKTAVTRMGVVSAPGVEAGDRIVGTLRQPSQARRDPTSVLREAWRKHGLNCMHGMTSES